MRFQSAHHADRPNNACTRLPTYWGALLVAQSHGSGLIYKLGLDWVEISRTEQEQDYLSPDDDGKHNFVAGSVRGAFLAIVQFPQQRRMYGLQIKPITSLTLY